MHAKKAKPRSIVDTMHIYIYIENAISLMVTYDIYIYIENAISLMVTYVLRVNNASQHNKIM